jgi:hypothetical protein
MALVKTVLDEALQEAFKQAMTEFINVTKNSNAKDVSDAAIAAASSKFATVASTAIDAYIKSATIIIPPGQAVLVPPSAGSTTSPSLPAIIK